MEPSDSLSPPAGLLNQLERLNLPGGPKTDLPLHAEDHGPPARLARVAEAQERAANPQFVDANSRQHVAKC